MNIMNHATDMSVGWARCGGSVIHGRRYERLVAAPDLHAQTPLHTPELKPGIATSLVAESEVPPTRSLVIDQAGPSGSLVMIRTFTHTTPMWSQQVVLAHSATSHAHLSVTVVKRFILCQIDCTCAVYQITGHVEGVGHFLGKIVAGHAGCGWGISRTSGHLARGRMGHFVAHLSLTCPRMPGPCPH